MSAGGTHEPPSLRESIRVVASRLPLLPLHLERLAEGGVAPAVLAAVAASAEVTAASSGPEVVKLHVTVGPAAGTFSVDVDTHPSSLAVPGGPAIVPVTVRALPALPTAAAKPADRSYWDGPQRLARLRGGDQAVLVTPAGEVVDGGTATVWAVRGSTLVTPPAPPAIAGVARRFVLADLAPALGLACEVRALALDELLAADEIVLTNAIGGVVPARGHAGPVGTGLAEAWEAALVAL